MDSGFSSPALWYKVQYTIFVNRLLNMQISQQATSQATLAQRINQLLSRQNICGSLYLAKFISPSLSLPLHAIAEERSIAQLTTDRELIRRTVQQSRLANVISDDEVQLIAYPTIKLPLSNQLLFKQLETVLTQLQKQYAFSHRCQDDCINLTLYEEEPGFLQQVMSSLSQQVAYEEVNLYDDIRAGTSAAKQNKNHHWKGHHHKKHYSLERPPLIFIRRAIDSEEEEPEREKRGKEGKEGREGRRKYREVTREAPVPKPMFSSEDFPLLS